MLGPVEAAHGTPLYANQLFCFPTPVPVPYAGRFFPQPRARKECNKTKIISAYTGTHTGHNRFGESHTVASPGARVFCMCFVVWKNRKRSPTTKPAVGGRLFKIFFLQDQESTQSNHTHTHTEGTHKVRTGSRATKRSQNQ